LKPKQQRKQKIEQAGTNAKKQKGNNKQNLFGLCSSYGIILFNLRNLYLSTYWANG
jgi:hypothetical protein